MRPERGTRPIAMKRSTAVLLLLLACAPARNVMVNGRQVPYEEGARIELGAAKASFDAGKYDLAAQQFASFIQRYRDSDLLDEALFRHGQALAKANKLREAQVALQDFLERRPTSPFKNSAVVELAAIQARLGQPAPPLPPVDPSQMSEQDKNQAAAALAESYARNGQWGEAMRLGARALETASSAESEPRLKQYERAVEAAPAPDIARLVSDLDRKSPAWPAPALNLARIQLHTADRSHAAEHTRDGPSPGRPARDGARTVQQAAQ